MTLSGEQRGKLQRALLSAFPTYADLQQMVGIRLEENLEAIAGTGKLQDVTYNLIDWVEEKGRLDDLIRSARAHNPGNPNLKAFAAALGVTDLSPAAPPKVSLAKLPSSSPLLVGR